MSDGWIGVDFDGTLAHYDGWLGDFTFGPPVPEMLERVKKWIDDGRTVKIFTARVSDEGAAEVTAAIQDWCAKHGLPRLEVTCVKDFRMIELYDDRAVTVEANTGRLLAPSSRKLS